METGCDHNDVTTSADISAQHLLSAFSAYYFASTLFHIYIRIIHAKAIDNVIKFSTSITFIEIKACNYIERFLVVKSACLPSQHTHTQQQVHRLGHTPADR